MAARARVALALAVGILPGQAAAQVLDDPFETLNRVVFSANLAVYDHVLAPVARSYRWATTESQRESVVNFLANVRAPAVAANQMLQGDGGRAATTLGRFAINSTFGVLGLFDPATKWGYGAQEPEDFGQTLARYGAPAGPYLVLPLVGPSSVRDAAGRLADYLALNTYLDTEALSAMMAATAVADAEPGLETFAAERPARLDLYATARSVYGQRREAAIRNGGAPGAADPHEDIFAE